MEEVDLTDFNVMHDPKLDNLVDVSEIFNIPVKPQQGFSLYCSLTMPSQQPKLTKIAFHYVQS